MHLLQISFRLRSSRLIWMSSFDSSRGDRGYDVRFKLTRIMRSQCDQSPPLGLTPYPRSPVSLLLTSIRSRGVNLHLSLVSSSIRAILIERYGPKISSIISFRWGDRVRETHYTIFVCIQNEVRDLSCLQADVKFFRLLNYLFGVLSNGSLLM